MMLVKLLKVRLKKCQFGASCLYDVNRRPTTCLLEHSLTKQPVNSSSHCNCLQHIVTWDCKVGKLGVHMPTRACVSWDEVEDEMLSAPAWYGTNPCTRGRELVNEWRH